MTNTNSHYMWNSKHPETQYPLSNDIYFNIVKKEKGKDSFRLQTNKFPNVVNPTIELMSNPNLYKEYDIAEILRSDFSRLFFDIDVDNGVYTPEELHITFKQIVDILNILNIPTSNLNGVIETTLNKPFNLPNEWLETFPQLLHIPTPYNDKEFSAHFYVSGYYFNRDDLFDIFSQGKNHYCKDPELMNHFSSYIDQSIYVRQGAQKVFRFGLSGKAMKGRPAPPFTDYQLKVVASNLTKFVFTKTIEDTQLISSTSQQFNHLKTYMNQFKFNPNQRDTRRISKKDLLEELQADADSEIHVRQTKKYIAKQSVHAQWWHSLILQMKNYLLDHPQASDDELFNEFSKEEYQYFSNSNNKKLYQPSSVHAAIVSARTNPRISIEDVIDISDSKTGYEEFNNIKNSIQYTLDEFKIYAQHPNGISIPEACKLIHYTFAFFTRSDSDKSSILQILYTETKDKKIVIKDYEQFLRQMKTSPIFIRLQRQIIKEDKRKKDSSPQIIPIIQVVSLQAAFDIFDKYKQRFYDFRLCAKNTENLKYFSLYSNPTFSNYCPLPQEIDTILNILSTELSEEPNQQFTINQKKKEYILNWFAYLLQHPESRNAVCLQISTVQGVGKNLLSNAICDYLGSFFSEPSKDIDKVIGTYNGGIDNKLLIVMNEVDNSKKNTDLLKAIITEDTIQINVKYGLQYTGLNCANYLIYTNHIDTNTISNGDRRFTFIKSYGLPMPKSFYASICVPGKEGHLRPEIREQFIKHLLSRDLSNYSPSEAEEFDKYVVIEQRQESRSAIHTYILNLLKSNNYPKDYILVSDVINFVNKCLKFEEFNIFTKQKNQTISEEYNIPELKDIEKFIKAELSERKCDSFSAKALSNIINFNDETELEKIKSNKRDDTRNKYVIRLRTPKILTKEINQPQIQNQNEIQNQQNEEFVIDI